MQKSQDSSHLICIEGSSIAEPAGSIAPTRLATTRRAEVTRPADFVSCMCTRAFSKTPAAFYRRREIHPRESPGPPTKIGQQRRGIRGNAGRCAHTLRRCPRLCVPRLWVRLYSSIPLKRSFRTATTSSSSSSPSRESVFVRRRSEVDGGVSAVYPGARYSARRTFGLGSPPTDVSKTPLRDLAGIYVRTPRSIPGAAPKP